MKKTALALVCIGIMAGAIIVLKDRPEASVAAVNDPKHVVLTLGDGRVRAKIASSSQDRARGLSGTKSLTDSEAMLFVFEEVGSYGFWMKDMLMPIDMIWLSKDREVVFVAPNVPPESYPQVFGTKTRAQYVLEVRAGWVQDMRVKVGDKAQW